MIRPGFWFRCHTSHGPFIFIISGRGFHWDIPLAQWDKIKKVQFREAALFWAPPKESTESEDKISNIDICLWGQRPVMCLAHSVSIMETVPLDSIIYFDRPLY